MALYGPDYELPTSNLTDYNFNWTVPIELITPEIQPAQIAALFFYSLVVLLGVPGNALVVWVTGFCMPRSVTSLWFLNLALADLLCCLSIPLLMVPLANDDHWHFGSLACILVKGIFNLVMYCSVLQLALISVDRWMMVSRPVWCQNNRRPAQAACACVAVWCLALIGSIPQFVFTKEIRPGENKRECATVNTHLGTSVVTSVRFLLGFLLPFAVIVVCHWVVYRRARLGMSRARSRSTRTVRIIVAVVLSFFLCWIPLHIVDFQFLHIRRVSTQGPKLYMAHVLCLCLAYFNSCLNPLLYVCLGRGFKDSMNRSLRSVFNFISEDPATRTSIAASDTKSSSVGKDMSRV